MKTVLKGHKGSKMLAEPGKGQNSLERGANSGYRCEIYD